MPRLNTNDELRSSAVDSRVSVFDSSRNHTSSYRGSSLDLLQRALSQKGSPPGHSNSPALSLFSSTSERMPTSTNEERSSAQQFSVTNSLDEYNGPLAIGDGKAAFRPTRVSRRFCGRFLLLSCMLPVLSRRSYCLPFFFPPALCFAYCMFQRAWTHHHLRHKCLGEYCHSCSQSKL